MGLTLHTVTFPKPALAPKIVHIRITINRYNCLLNAQKWMHYNDISQLAMTPSRTIDIKNEFPWTDVAEGNSVDGS